MAGTWADWKEPTHTAKTLATAVGAGDFIWRAYLSTQARPGKPAINARDRIGEGPWHNFNGVMIASSVAHLHGDTLELARMGNNLHKQTGLTEKGAIVPGLYDFLDPRDRRLGIRQDNALFQPSRSADRLSAGWPGIPPGYRLHLR